MCFCDRDQESRTTLAFHTRASESMPYRCAPKHQTLNPNPKPYTLNPEPHGTVDTRSFGMAYSVGAVNSGLPTEAPAEADAVDGEEVHEGLQGLGFRV